MSITAAKVTLPLRGNIIDFCLEMQRKGVVVSLVQGEFMGIRIHLPEELPRITSLLRIRTTTNPEIDEYTFRDETGVTCVVYGKEAAEAYHPPRVRSIATMRNVRPMVTFVNKNLVKSFHHQPEEIVEEILYI